MRGRTPPVTAALGVLLTAACARDHGSWPSLAPRAAEARRLDDPGSSAVPPSPINDPPPAPVAPPDPGAPREWNELQPKIAPAGVALDAAVARARGKPSGSDAWAQAQVELSRAEALALRADDLAGRTPEGTFPGLDGARAALARRIDAAKAALAR